MRAQSHPRAFKTHRAKGYTTNRRESPGDTAGAGVRTPPTPGLSDSPRSRSEFQAEIRTEKYDS